MPQNSKKHIKEHIENFLEFYKKNRAHKEVQIAKLEVCIARKSKEMKENPKPTVKGPNPRHWWIRISLDASKALD